MKISKKRFTQILATAVASTLLIFGLSGCVSSEYDNRKDDQSSITLDESLETANLQEKLERQNDPNAVRYVYLMSYAEIIGYYVIQGKVSSNGSQLAPEQEIICRYNSGDSCQAVDSAQDDGSYGSGDPGIFFFTSDGILVETSLDYIVSDSPLAVDVPRLIG